MSSETPPTQPAGAAQPQPGYGPPVYPQPQPVYVTQPGYVAPQVIAVTGAPQHLVYVNQGPKNSLATAALTLGIIALALFWFPFVGIILALIGVGLGIPAIIKAQKDGVGMTMAIWGVSLSGASMLLFFALVAIAG